MCAMIGAVDRSTSRSLEGTIDRWLASLASVNTRQAYRRDLADYNAFLAAAKSDPLTADSNQVRAFLADLEARGFRASSAARRIRCAEARCCSWVPCEKFRRKTSVPAAMRARTASSVSLAGPIVEMILVRRTVMRTSRRGYRLLTIAALEYAVSR